MKHKPDIYKSYFALAVGILLCISGCKSAQLQVLENSALVVQLTTGREVSRSLQDQDWGFKGPIYAEIRIEYEPIDHYTKKEVYDEIVAILKKNHWERDAWNITPGYFSASLQQVGFALSASVLIREKENLVSLHLVNYNLSGRDLETASPTSPPSPTRLPQATTTQTGLTSMKGKDGMTLLYVPAGEFTMGSDNGELGEKPVHTVYLAAFWIDQTEVTNEMYAKCAQAGQCDPPGRSTVSYFDLPGYAKHPVVYVDWEMANAYCSWAGRRLPTEAEWEKAARGTDAFTYPWGEGIDCERANYQSSCVYETSPVGSYERGKSPYGAYDMAGNVSEWVNDWYGESYYQSSPALNPAGPDSGQDRVLRGGNWAVDGRYVRSTVRGRGKPSSMSYYQGFRCSSSLP